MFCGANSINLDSKGRIAIPAKYRPAIVESNRTNLTITCSPFDKCLLIFIEEQWESTKTQLNSLSDSRKEYRALKRIMLDLSDTVEMDANGRLLIPAVLRERINASKELMLIGQTNKFQLWNEVEWKQQTQKDFELLSDSNLDPDELPELHF